MKQKIQIGDLVICKVPLTDERGATVEAGTKLRVVAIPPKIFRTRAELIQHHPDLYDSKQDFLNLVRAKQENDYINRFRVHFVTVRKASNPTELS